MHWYRPVVNRIRVPELETLQSGDIQGFTVVEAGALVGACHGYFDHRTGCAGRLSTLLC